MKDRVWAVLLTATMGLGLLAGCGEERPPSGAEPTPEMVESSTKLDKPPQPEQILSDVNAFRYTVLPEGAAAVSCEVIKRQSNPEDKEDVVYCRLTAPSNRFTLSAYYVKLRYNFYDEGGWILDGMEADQTDLWGPVDFMDGEGRPLTEVMTLIDADPEPEYPSDFLEYIERTGMGAAARELEVDSAGMDEAALLDALCHAYYHVYYGASVETISAPVNDRGVYRYNGSLYDSQGNVLVSGFSGGFIGGDRYYKRADDGLFYLCAWEGTVLSQGYDDITYATSDEYPGPNGYVPRWRAVKGELVGFLDENGQEVVPVSYPRAYTYRSHGGELAENKQTPTFSRGLCLMNDGEYRQVIDESGRVLMRYHMDDYGGFEPCRRGFSLAETSGNYYEHVYDLNGQSILPGKYFDISITDEAICARTEERWEVYAWEGHSTGWKSLDSWFLSRLPDNVYFSYGDDGCRLLAANGDLINSFVGGASYGYDAVITGDSGVMALDGSWTIYPDDYTLISPVGGGLYTVSREDGSTALYDWQGNQRTPFYEDILDTSENGAYFTVMDGGRVCLLPSPLTKEETAQAPALIDAYIM